MPKSHAWPVCHRSASSWLGGRRADAIASYDKDAVDRRTANVQPLRDLCGAKSLRLEFLHLGLINRRLPTPVDACRLGFGDTLKLSLAPQVGLELGERKHFPAAVLVSIGCAVALRVAPLALRFNYGEATAVWVDRGDRLR